jgi:2'-5' RNA ligase
MRCFIAIELEQRLRTSLLSLIRENLPASRDVKWCTEHQLHVTLKFLGDTPDDRISSVCEAVANASERVTPFTIKLATLGCFPNGRNPRVLWCGVDDPSGGCARWVELADPLLAEAGFPRENRAYHPHITLGRSKNASGGHLMSELLRTSPAPVSREMLVERVTVFESQLSPRGARYITRFTANLGD